MSRLKSIGFAPDCVAAPSAETSGSAARKAAGASDIARTASRIERFICPSTLQTGFQIRSGKRFVHNQSMDISQPEVATLKTVNQFRMIEAQEVKDRRMQVVNM